MNWTIKCFNAERELIETLTVPDGAEWIRIDGELGPEQTIRLPQVLYVDDPPFYTDADRSYDIHAIERDHGRGSA